RCSGGHEADRATNRRRGREPEGQAMSRSWLGLMRQAAGVATVLGGGWLIRALRGAPAAVGADRRDIRPVGQRSPNYRDGAFVNLDPASIISLDRQQQWVLAREFLDGRAATRPAAPI